MASTKPLEDATVDFSGDLNALRDDITKLSASVADLVKAQASAASGSVRGAVDQARQKIADTTSDAQERVGAIGADLEAAIERNPLTALLIALSAGIVVGMLMRPHTP